MTNHDLESSQGISTTPGHAATPATSRSRSSLRLSVATSSTARPAKAVIAGQKIGEGIEAEGDGVVVIRVA